VIHILGAKGVFLSFTVQGRTINTTMVSIIMDMFITANNFNALVSALTAELIAVGRGARS